MRRFRSTTVAVPVAAVLALSVGACDGGVESIASPDADLRRNPSQEAIDYYVEVALGTEFGGTSPVIRKWADPLVVRVEGEPRRTDLDEVSRVVEDLNRLRRGPGIRLANPGSDAAERANVVVHFAPRARFPRILAHYVPGNDGFFWVWFDGRDRIERAVVLIDSQTDRPEIRAHLIREELTQILGLGNDSSRFPGSIFYAAHPPTPTDFTAMDRRVIEIHARADIESGMTEREVRRRLAGS